MEDDLNQNGRQPTQNGLVLESDFEGVFEKDMNSALRKRVQRVKSSSSDPVVMGRILAKDGNRKVLFVRNTECFVNILPERFASICGLKCQKSDLDEAAYTSATNRELEVVGQTVSFVKLDIIKHPVKLEFLVVADDVDEALLSLDTLKELSIVHKEFPLLMDRSKREPKIRRVRDPNCEEVESVSDANKLVELKVRIGSLRTQLTFRKVEEEDFEEADRCVKLRRKLLEDYSDIF